MNVSPAVGLLFELLVFRYKYDAGFTVNSCVTVWLSTVALIFEAPARFAVSKIVA